MGLQKALVFK